MADRSQDVERMIFLRREAEKIVRELFQPEGGAASGGSVRRSATTRTEPPEARSASSPICGPSLRRRRRLPAGTAHARSSPLRGGERSCALHPGSYQPWLGVEPTDCSRKSRE